MNQRNKPRKEKAIVYGIHPVIEAMEADQSLEKIMIRHGNNHGKIRDIKTMAKVRKIPVQQVPEEKLRRLCRDENHQGVIAQYSAVPYQSLESVILSVQEKGETPLFVLLDGVTDVRNFGAIARSAECMGAHALIVPASGSAPLNADALKTSAGALNHIPVCREGHLVDSLLLLQAYDIRTVGCTEKTSTLIFGEDLTGPLCLVMGDEERGISSSLLKRVDALVALPMLGKIGSLNVSVAAGMALIEVVRQRRIG